MASLDAENDDNEYEIPLQDQRIFGAGIKRKRVRFVPSSTQSTIPSSSSTPAPRSVGDLYLSLVLPKQTAETTETVSHTDLLDCKETETSHLQICEVCRLPLSLDRNDAVAHDDTEVAIISKSRPHEASIAHQVCLTHSHPPSHIDRNRKGLTFLSSYGWDPDARVGLGANGQGIQYPIKTKEKNDKLGIGVVIPKDKDLEKLRKVKEIKLDAGKVRRLAEKDKMRTEQLREAFYRSEDVERYLGRR